MQVWIGTIFFLWCFAYFPDAAAALETRSTSVSASSLIYLFINSYCSFMRLMTWAGSVSCLCVAMVVMFVPLVTWCGLALSDQEGALCVAGGQQEPHGIDSGEILKKPAGTTTTKKNTQSYTELEEAVLIHSSADFPSSCTHETEMFLVFMISQGGLGTLLWWHLRGISEAFPHSPLQSPTHFCSPLVSCLFNKSTVGSKMTSLSLSERHWTSIWDS